MYWQDWKKVLLLSRLVVTPNAPRNSCSFLLAGSMRLIDRDRWPFLLTYADEWQGHTGAIYKAANWTYLGKTDPTPVYTLNGKVISHRTVTRRKMKGVEGLKFEGYFSKHKFVHAAHRI